jgi:uroporphyrinogen-III synthase
MPLPLAGRVVALAETRQLGELVAMLEKEGATPVPVPMVAILDADDPAPVANWLRDLVAGKFAYVVFMTGEGVRRLLTAAEAGGTRDAVLTALAATRSVVRGPKPAAVLKEVGLKPSLVSDAPTTDGLIATLSREPLSGQTVGVQLHGEDNPRLTEFLRSAGATVSVVQPYHYAPAADAEQVADLIRRMADGKIDALVITSSPQVERMAEVAIARGLQDELRRGLERTCVAAVGPVVAETLRRHGAKADICPDRGFVMKKLVQLLGRGLGPEPPAE